MGDSMLVSEYCYSRSGGVVNAKPSTESAAQLAQVHAEDDDRHLERVRQRIETIERVTAADDGNRAIHGDGAWNLADAGK